MDNILITGVNGGMGAATAKYFVEKGYNVYGIDIQQEPNNKDINFFSCDLRNIEDIEKIYSIISQKITSLQTIIHLSGIYNMDSLIEIDENDYKKIFDVNLLAVYRINKTFYPLLKKGSKIIILSSELAPLFPLPFTGLYAITKGALEKYAFSLAMELNLKDIFVSVIRPGAVDTGMIGSSVSSLDRLRDKTKVYQYNTKRFHKIVDSVESRKISPIKIAKLNYKVVKTKKHRLIYTINRNFLLILLNLFPKKFQLYVIKKVLSK